MNMEGFENIESFEKLRETPKLSKKDFEKKGLFKVLYSEPIKNRKIKLVYYIKDKYA